MSQQGVTPNWTDGPATRSQWAEERLRRAILERKLQPGERLNIKDLTASWKVSPTPLREALQRLSTQGLITITPQRGAFVTELSEKDLREVYDLRMLLEPMAAEDSIKHLAPDGRERIRLARDSLISAYSREDPDHLERERAHRSFHLAVVDNCQSGWLLRLVTSLLDYSTRYRSVSTILRGGDQAVIDEHVDVAARALEGDAAGVRHSVEHHLKRTFEAALRHLATIESDQPESES